MNNLVANFGSRFFILVFPFPMPCLTPTPEPCWRVQAKRWRKANPGRDAAGLAWEERKGSDRARAAFWVATALPRGSGPQPEGCQLCGVATHSWCEGCYQRAGGGESYSAVCQRCDGDHLVCPVCTQAGITWQTGHEAYVQTHGDDDEETIEVSVDPAAPPSRIKISTLASSLGIPVEQLKADLVRSLGGGGSAGR